MIRGARLIDQLEASMQTFIRRRRPSTTLGASLIVPALMLLVAASCDEPDGQPTSPSNTGARRAPASVVAANVTILPTLGGRNTYVSDINEAGQVVGSSEFNLTGDRHAFLWSAAGGMQDLGTLGGTTSEAAAINDAGQVVGSSELAATGVRHAFLWTPGLGMQDLGTFGGPSSFGRGLNDRGQVVGSSATLGGATRPFLWIAGQGMQDLGTLGASSASAIAVNDAGHVTGTSATAAGEVRAFLWTPGQGMRDLGALEGDPTAATAINETGYAVGFTQLGPDARPFIWTPGQGMRALGVPPVGVAWDINDGGVVVGRASAVPGGSHAFVWTALTGTEDLYATTGMSEAVAVNNRGQVVGSARVATLQFDDAFVTGAGFYAIAGKGPQKAHFTFSVGRFGHGGTPNGTVRFWIPGVRVEFESAAIEMLVMVANRVQFWGTGTLNGAAARFRLTAVDGEAAGTGDTADALRVELWQAGTLVFDSQPGAAPGASVTTELDGGRIQIRR